jgi:subtilase family serine protease
LMLRGVMTIFASVSTLLIWASAGVAAPSSGPLTPATLHSAYELPRTAPNRALVAIVVAYHNPTLGQDLQTFSRRFKLPACTAASGCLRQVNQRGQSKPLPSRDPTGGGWTTEAALSTETLHGVCQNCRLLIVEADSDDRSSLATAVDTAARLGAREISTSYVFTEGLFDPNAAPYYNHPGVVITAASGDGGFSFGTNVPAAYPGVVAVGGTNLRVGRRGQWAGETPWRSADGTTASGCSGFTSAPVWQSPFTAEMGCPGKRVVVDVAAAAGPGAPLFSSTPLNPQGQRGWFEADGTSLSSPIVAGVFALAGGIHSSQSAAAILYAHLHTRNAFHDIAQGTNGSCGGKPICQAGRGYDGVTGVGTPRGLAGFRAG